ncbi:oligoendopeptidase F [Parasphaerochaeta coccoides]|uniref:Oligopeptidase F n=1 Tax=Parasphaerochaeta coccoides (strain ATCC BAA-1237 / DSM 17374 / SPN1) TaxID=760011 RepID=F4GHC4_PARC1|nr:oligopeptidase F [Parasphaerochaeta coccoides DSM 17374]
MNKTPQRNEVPVKDTWDLSSLFAMEEEWDATLAQFKGMIDQAAQYKGTLGTSSDALYAVLGWYIDASQKIERLGNYAFLRFSVDGTNTDCQKRMGLVQQAATDFSAATSWFDPEIQAVDSHKLDSWLAEERFTDYRIMVARLIRFKPHVLTENEEKLLALASDATTVSRTAFQDLTNIDMDFGMITTPEGDLPLTQTTWSSFMNNPDRELRKSVYRQFYKVYATHKHVLGRLYEGSVKKDIFKANSRAFPSARAAALFPDNVPMEVYDSLVSSVHDALPLLHRYYDIRRRALGLDKLAHYDVYVPLVSGVDTVTPYDEAVGIIAAALKPLGDEYGATITAGLTTERWVDRYENVAKRSGAFSSGAFSGKPYIMMNYKEDVLRDVFTLAHEGGHSMHSWYSARNNPYPHYDYTIFEAEVASTFNEQLVAKYLFDTAKDDKMRAYIIGKQIDDLLATLFRQTMFAEYEDIIHRQAEEGEPITLEGLRSTYRGLLVQYFGSLVEFEENSDLEGLRIPHFYNAFYVYKYATGISAAIALSDKVLSGTTNDRDAYLSFLKSGGSLFPIDSLKKAGVDMSSPEPVRAATRKFASLLDQFEELTIGK